MTIIDDILERQAHLDFSADSTKEVPSHHPEMLLIGCVDARKDPIGDLGIPKGRVLILRNIAALIRGTSVAPEQRETESAALEFAVKVMKIKHIAVMGHTDCGGIRAALQEIDFPCVKRYLSPLNKIKERVRAKGGSLDEQAAVMERQAVYMSVKNIRSYPYISDLEATGDLSLHGWILDISTNRLEVII